MAADCIGNNQLFYFKNISPILPNQLNTYQYIFGIYIRKKNKYYLKVFTISWIRILSSDT